MTKVHVVFGAPCSGKSTYVQENKGENDLIYDFDSIMSSISGLNSHITNENLISYVVDFRNLILNNLKNEGNIENAYIITTFLKDDLKELLQDLDFEYIKMNTTKETCLERLNSCTLRDKEASTQVINDWFETYGNFSEAQDKVVKMINKKWFEVKNQTSLSSDLYFYGDIVSSEWDKWEETDTTASDVRDYLNSIDENMALNIYINSPGGVVTAGIAIYNMLKRHKGYKTVYIDGIAASIASIIPFAADKIVMYKSAFMMVHLPWVGVSGNKHDLQQAMNTLETIEASMMDIYFENLRDEKDQEKFRSLVDSETWLTGEEAAALFNIELIDGLNAVACASDLYKNYKKVPTEIVESIKNEVAAKDENEKLKFENELALLEI